MRKVASMTGIGRCLVSAALCAFLAGCVTTDWKTAQQQNSLEAYNLFLAKYPSSQHSSAARQKMQLLKEQEAKAALSKADDIGTEEAYKNMIKDYPDTDASREAAAAIKRSVAPADIKRGLSDKWATDWLAFVSYFQPYFDKGELSAEDKAALTKTMHGASVTWSGTLKSINNGTVFLNMQPSPLRFKLKTNTMTPNTSPYNRSYSSVIWFASGSETTTSSFGQPITGDASTYVVDSLAVTPRWNNRKAWSSIKPGQKVTFRAVLLHSGINQVFVGLGPNEGKIFVTWQTEDAELIQDKTP